MPAQLETLPLAELLELPSTYPDQPRIHFSQALAWLELSSPDDARKALACLRSADALGFEGKERLTLHRAIALARCGEPGLAKELASSLHDRELTKAECPLRDAVLDVSTPISETGAQADERQSRIRALAPRSLLVINDSAALSAGWVPEASYVLVAPQVTGISLSALAALGLEFDLGMATEADQNLAEQTGVRCERWLEN